MEVRNPLASSPMYPYLHQFLLGIGASLPAGLNSQEIFAEVFNICRRAATDATPGENLALRYIIDLQQRVGNQRHTELILCLSWVVLLVQEHPSYAITTFSQRLQPLLRHSSFFNKSRQLAITIRQYERHLHTDFLAPLKPYPEMKVEIEGNPGTGNTFNENTYNIHHVETLAPNATTVINKHYHFDGKKEDIKGIVDEDNEIDIEPIRKEILIWVSKVRTFLCGEWKDHYQKDWETILDWPEVKEKVYDPGKQKNTNFNQYLVGNILYYIFEACGAMSEDQQYNASALCTALIGTTEHQLRKELAKNPPADVEQRLRKYFTK